MLLPLIGFPLVAILAAIGIVIALPRRDVPRLVWLAALFVAAVTITAGAVCAALTWTWW